MTHFHDCMMHKGLFIKAPPARPAFLKALFFIFVICYFGKIASIVLLFKSCTVNLHIKYALSYPLLSCLVCPVFSILFNYFFCLHSLFYTVFSALFDSKKCKKLTKDTKTFLAKNKEAFK